MGLGRLLEACQLHEKVALEHSSKSAKYELEGSYNDQVHEHFSQCVAIAVAVVAENPKKPYCTRIFLMENKNRHGTDFYKAKRRIDDMSLHKRTRRIQQ